MINCSFNFWNFCCKDNDRFIVANVAKIVWNFFCIRVVPTVRLPLVALWIIFVSDDVSVHVEPLGPGSAFSSALNLEEDGVTGIYYGPIWDLTSFFRWGYLQLAFYSGYGADLVLKGWLWPSHHGHVLSFHYIWLIPKIFEKIFQTDWKIFITGVL